jgi:hypothetical protein
LFSMIMASVLSLISVAEIIPIWADPVSSAETLSGQIPRPHLWFESQFASPWKRIISDNKSALARESGLERIWITV